MNLHALYEWFRTAPESWTDTDYPVRAERGVWRAVITQALMDAGSGSRKPEYRRLRREAALWLTGMSEDFVTVCELADYSPALVRELAICAMANQCRWRAPARSKARSDARHEEVCV